MDDLQKLEKWYKENQEELRKYPDHHLAISLSKGIVASGDDDIEFERSLASIDPELDDVILVHTSILTIFHTGN